MNQFLRRHPLVKDWIILILVCVVGGYVLGAAIYYVVTRIFGQ